jgi:hypothetical protein
MSDRIGLARCRHRRVQRPLHSSDPIDVTIGLRRMLVKKLFKLLSLLRLLRELRHGMRGHRHGYGSPLTIIMAITGTRARAAIRRSTGGRASQAQLSGERASRRPAPLSGT